MFNQFRATQKDYNIFDYVICANALTEIQITL